MPHVAQAVIYRSPDHGNEPLCALVAAIVGENLVNLTVFAKDGSYAGGHGRIPFVPLGGDVPQGPYCEYAVAEPRLTFAERTSPNAQVIPMSAETVVENLSIDPTMNIPDREPAKQ